MSAPIPAALPRVSSHVEPTSNALPANSEPRSPSEETFTRSLFFRGLGLIHLLAFLSLWSQLHGLIGSQGLLPVEHFFKLARDKLGTAAYQQLPSLCWFAASDLMLHLWCALGTGLSVTLLLGLAPRLVLLLLWSIYLSLSVAGQAFLGFQWDSLLLEMTLCSVLYAPRGLRPNWRTAAAPLPIARWLLWGLAFKLMFLSGVTKLLSGDASWTDGTALQFHYYTQPIPSWTSWYASQWPLRVHLFSLWIMFLFEVLLPFFIFAGRRGRAIFGLATIALMVVIEATGNFGFFNLQTIVLSIPLLNDGLLLSLVSRHRRNRAAASSPDAAASSSHAAVAIRTVPRPIWRRIVGSTVATAILAVSGLTLVREMVRSQQGDKLPLFVVSGLGLAERSLLSWSEPAILTPLAPLRTINGYGLFRVMTTHRPEIIIETSHDAITWDSLEFPYKPGRVDRAPPIIAPQMPRLDWQMWFAALNPRSNEYWLSSLSQRILEGNPSTARLLGQPQLATHPPKYVRLSYYEYKFSTSDQRQATGAWWSRSHTGHLTGPLSRRTEANGANR